MRSLVKSKIFYRSATNREYEITVEHDPFAYVPKNLREDYKGTIEDTDTYHTWPSLIHMSNDLKVEVIEWGSEIGD